MSARRRIPLNPCDTLTYAYHKMLLRERRGGNIAFMMLDIDGRLEPDRLRGALADVMLAHPVTMAGLRLSQPRGRPYWKIPRSRTAAAQRFAAQAHTYDDLRTAGDWADRLACLCQQRYVPHWDLRAGPQVRVEQYDLPDEQTRLVLRWPHLFMDAEGAQWFLAELGKSRSTATSPPNLCHDQPIDVLDGCSFWRRLALFLQGVAGQQAGADLPIKPLVPPSDAPLGGYRLITRHFDAAQTERIQSNARRAAPPGPALYSRFLAAAVIRALHRLYAERGIETGAYLITFPMRVGFPDDAADHPVRRPLPGNYLIAPTLCGRRERAGDIRALGEDILSQLQAHHRDRTDLAQWSALWLLSFLHAWFYPLVFKLPLGIGDFSSGFSYYGEIDPPLRTLFGKPITNIWGGGPVATPPGWNPVFSRFRDRLNFSLTWNHPAVSDDVARRYAELIEQEAIEPRP